MLVLILAIASFLVFFGIVILLCIADTLESRTIRREKNLSVRQPLPLLSISEAFDPIYSVLWEAPIAALELVGSGGTNGIPVARLRPIYQQAAAHFPEIYEGGDFVQWIQFFESLHLMSWHNFNVVLTPEARAFLKFRFVSDVVIEA